MKTGLEELLPRFIQESNRIEGIVREVTETELDGYRTFLNLANVTVADLQGFLAVIEPKAKLRTEQGMDVTVGGKYVPPKGGPSIEPRLRDILQEGHRGMALPYTTHCQFESLHPFTDGNGRAGRAFWLWQIATLGTVDQLYQVHQLGFLHTFYYQTLSASRVGHVAKFV